MEIIGRTSETGYVPDILRPAPPLFECAESELHWLVPVEMTPRYPTPNLLWDHTPAALARPGLTGYQQQGFPLTSVTAGSEARGLLKKALATPLTPEQSQSITAALEADPSLVSPARL